MTSLHFAKGHGTGNDFVITVDRTNLTPLSDAQVSWLCDRHFGIGGDGLLRAVKAVHHPDADTDADLWFMDYRNADGSVAEMCGNGLRVFARYLVEEGLVDDESFQVATRAGVKTCEPHLDGSVTVDLGPVHLTEQVTVTLAGHSYPAQGVDVGNPHAVVLLDAETELAALPVHQPPSWMPTSAFPDGVNVEFVQVIGPQQLRLRVHERGSGETLSCGTGIVAAVAAQLASVAPSVSANIPSGQVSVSVPGGEVTVELSAERSLLRGPAVVLARGEVHLPDQLSPADN